MSTSEADPPRKRPRPANGNGSKRDQRTKINADPEEALRAMLRTRRKREPRSE